MCDPLCFSGVFLAALTVSFFKDVLTIRNVDGKVKEGSMFVCEKLHFYTERASMRFCFSVNTIQLLYNTKGVCYNPPGCSFNTRTEGVEHSCQAQRTQQNLTKTV